MSAHRIISATRVFASGLLAASTLAACAREGEKEDQESTARSVVAAAPGDVAALDDRQAIRVDAATRFAVLKEMRTMLNAVQGVIGGAAQGDTATMRAAAASAGLAAASESEENVARQLGADFVQLGMRTHANFDSLAAEVTQGRSRDGVLRRLSTVMGNCVGCHNQFRLVVQP